MAPNAPVIVEMAPADAALPAAQALIEGCSSGLRDGGRCELAGEESMSEGSRAIVVVSWEGTGRLGARIEVGIAHGARMDWLKRRVTFDATDAEVERWRSVGLIIATVVGEAAPEPKREVAPPASAAPTPAPSADLGPATRSEPAPEPRRGPWSIEGGLEVARGAAKGFGAWGGGLRVSRRFGEGPLFVTASGRYELQSQATPQVALEWAWGAAGAGLAAPIPGAPLLIEVRLEPTIAWLRASAMGAASGGGVLVGAREGVGVIWWWTTWLGLCVGGDAVETTRSAVVRLSSASDRASYVPVATASWFGWSSTVGLRLDLP